VLIGIGGLVGAALGFFATRSLFGAFLGYFIGSSFDKFSSNNSKTSGITTLEEVLILMMPIIFLLE